MNTRIVSLSLALSLVACAARSPAPVASPSAPTVDEPAALPFSEAVRLTMAQSDYHPSEAALRATPSAARHGTVRAPLITQHGEIVVLEGGPKTVTAFDQGYGLVLNGGGVQNPMEIAKEFLASHPDEFDVLTVFTTFPDEGSQNSVAWYLAIRSSVKGIGAQAMDTGSFWGSQPGGRLHGFINMQYIGQYGTNLEDPASYVHSVYGQEFGHQWGTFVKYVDPTGQSSDALLGRDGSHWASTVQANGSVMDGNEWADLGGGKFQIKNNNYRWSELDQYIMGLRSPDDVPAFFRIDGATYKGQAIDPAQALPNGLIISGTREDITIDQIVKANGTRVPDYVNAPKDFRVAVILVTRPGENAESINTFVARLEGFRNTFEQWANERSDGRMRICTRSTAPCDSAGVVLTDVKVSESQGNGDGLIDPGDTVAIDFSVKSTGFGDAHAVTIDVQEPEEGALNIITSHLDLGDVSEGSTVKSPSPLLIKIPPSVGCGLHVKLPLVLTTDGRAFPASLDFDVGVRTIAYDGFEHPDLWVTNPYGTDNATLGMWEVAPPKGVDALYTGLNLVTQPSQDFSSDGANALVTGPEAGQIGEHDVDDGVTTALGPAYDLAEAKDPLLTWYSWHFAYDFNTAQGAVPVTNDALYTEASTDGGVTWTIIDVDTSNEQRWVRKQVRLSDAVPPGPSLRLRFTMSDDIKLSVAEALVDDIRVWDESPVCAPAPPKPDPTDVPDAGGADASPSTDATAPTADASTTPPPAAPGDSGGCSAGGRAAPVWVGLVLVALLLLRRRRSVLVALMAVAVIGCGDTSDPPAVTPAADVAVGEDTPVGEDVPLVEDTAVPDAGTDPDPGPTLGEGPSYKCLVESCKTSACMDVPECALAADCAADCNTIACAEACVKSAPPPFKGVVGDLVICGAKAACFAGGSGLEHCGDDDCTEEETVISCPSDCGIAGHPDKIYECIVASCQLNFCVNKQKCNAALQCITACTDSACTAECIQQNTGQGTGQLINAVKCGITAGCLPPEAGATCGDGKCELSEGPMDCPKDCGEPTPGYKCLLDGCASGFCVNSPTCNNVLVCLGLCTDGACSQACLDKASPQSKEFLFESLQCAVDAGCMPASALPPVCGDGTCDANEGSAICPDDCPKVPVCGDGDCDPGEETASSETHCPKDCEKPLPPSCVETACPTEWTACTGDAPCAAAGACLAACGEDAACATACGEALEAAAKELYTPLLACAEGKGCVKATP